MRGSRTSRLLAATAACLALAWTASCAGKHGKHVVVEDPVLVANREKAEEFSKMASVHAPVAAGECSTCHSSPEDPKKVKDKMPGLCVGCHPERQADLKKKHVHPPFAGGDCSACHDSHASENPGLLPDKVNAFCLTCHDAESDALKKAHFGITAIGADCTLCHDAHATQEKGKLIREEHFHPPFEGQGCDACHAATGKDGKSKLNGDGTAICYPCHSDLAEAGKGEKDHPPFATRECWACHWPHATKERAFLRKPVPALCGDCHEGIPAVGHPTGEHPTIRKGVRNPIDKEKTFDCASCHNPHRAKASHFLRGNWEELCRRCHEK